MLSQEKREQLIDEHKREVLNGIDPDTAFKQAVKRATEAFRKEEMLNPTELTKDTQRMTSTTVEPTVIGDEHIGMPIYDILFEELPVEVQTTLSDDVEYLKVEDEDVLYRVIRKPKEESKKD